jgi:hypothetical protein
MGDKQGKHHGVICEDLSDTRRQDLPRGYALSKDWGGEEGGTPIPFDPGKPKHVFKIDDVTSAGPGYYLVTSSTGQSVTVYTDGPEDAPRRGEAEIAKVNDLLGRHQPHDDPDDKPGNSGPTTNK